MTTTDATRGTPRKVVAALAGAGVVFAAAAVGVVVYEWRATPRVAEAARLTDLALMAPDFRVLDAATVAVRLRRPPIDQTAASGYRLLLPNGRECPGGTGFHKNENGSYWLVFAVPRRELAGPLTLVVPGGRWVVLPAELPEQKIADLSDR